MPTSVKILACIIVFFLVVAPLWNSLPPAPTSSILRDRFKPVSWADQIRRKVAEDAIEQFWIAHRQGDPIQICVQAGLVTAALLQLKDEAAYREWKEVENSWCPR